jgi:ATP-dependent Zn protease
MSVCPISRGMVLGKLHAIARHLAGMIGGRAAEIAIFGVPSYGAIADLEATTSMAYTAIAQVGLGGSLIALPTDLAM